MTTPVSEKIEDAYPLSSMQEGILFHSILAPESGVYIVQSAHILENVNIEAFREAWQQTLDMHPILRTAFAWKNVNRPLQLVRRHVALPIEIQDWRSLAPPERKERLNDYLRDDLRRGFSLSKAPLMRLALMQTQETEYYFVLTYHHLILDGWSLPLVLKDVFAHYTALCHAAPARLPGTRPYRDYINWLQQQDIAKAESYWRETLKGFATPTTFRVRYEPEDLPGDQLCMDEQELLISKELALALQAVGKNHRLTLNTILQGVWAILLSRYSGEQDVIFGGTVAGRPAELSGIESMVGLFINTLPVRVQVRPEVKVSTWLQTLQAAQAEQRQYEYSPLMQVQEWSEVARGTALFDNLFVYENYPLDKITQGDDAGLRVRTTRSTESSSYPLVAIVGLRPSLFIKIKYERHHYNTDVVERMLRHFQTLLESVVANPEQRLSQLPLLTRAEQEELLVQWNQTSASYPHERCLHQLFETQVVRTPEATALVFEQQQVSYDELNQRANKLAHYLRSLGVRAETLVGIAMERSVEMVVALLGVLKAGGAYVPLDSSYPMERLHFMLEDAGVSVLLTATDLEAQLPAYWGQTVCLDSDWETIAALSSGENVGSEVSADNLAFVIYTSGSTGKPKGVEIRHLNVIRLLCGVDYARLAGLQTFLQLSSISFDASTFELWGALLHGGRCVLSEERIPTIRSIGDAIRKHEVTILWLTASLFNALVDEAPESLSGVGQLLIGGEALSVPHVLKAIELLPDTEIINGYGPTESTTFTCCYAIPRNLNKSIRSIPIGRPISNTEVYILDDELRLLPVGVAGELYIGGDGLARGYLQQPALTAAKFIPHPFAYQGGARLYRTGDRARYLPDGNIEYLGRLDQQVKLRGYRIELGEIEAVLLAHPEVKEAVVVAGEDSAGEKRLVAYVVTGSEQRPDNSELREWLKHKLPDYMVPQLFVLLEALPLNASGKVDRRALPAPEQADIMPSGILLRPRDTLEFRLVRIWEDILNVKPIGITDNFFDIGGHSLSAVLLIARIKKLLGVSIPLSTLSHTSTVEGLAGYLRQRPSSLRYTPLIEIQPTGTKAPFICVHPAGGSILAYVSLSHYLGAEQPFYGLQAPGLDGECQPLSTIEEMASHYIEAMRSGGLRGPYYLGGWSSGGLVAYEMAQQLVAKGESIGLLALFDTSVETPGVFSPEADGAQTIDEAALLSQIFANGEIPPSIQQLEVNEQIEFLLERWKDTNVIPHDVEITWARSILEVYKANMFASLKYAPQTYDGDITFFKASERAAKFNDPTLGWKKLAPGRVKVYEIPGDHMTMIGNDDHVRVLAETLAACLEHARADKALRSYR